MQHVLSAHKAVQRSVMRSRLSRVHSLCSTMLLYSIVYTVPYCTCPVCGPCCGLLYSEGEKMYCGQLFERPTCYQGRHYLRRMSCLCGGLGLHTVAIQHTARLYTLLYRKLLYIAV